MTQAAVETHRLTDDGTFPNNADLPLVLYRRAMAGADAEARAQGFERAFTLHGWPAAWRYGIFGHHHYHATAHEALGVAAGSARIRFGGDGGVTVEVSAGDAVVVPAGVAHRNLGSSPDFLVVGAYPAGQSPDMNTGKAEERARAVLRVAEVPRPAQDPLFGPGGPLVSAWGGKGADGAAGQD